MSKLNKSLQITINDNPDGKSVDISVIDNNGYILETITVEDSYKIINHAWDNLAKKWRNYKHEEKLQKPE